MKKRLTSLQIFPSDRSASLHTLEEKVDELLQQLDSLGLSCEEMYAVQQYLNDQMERIGGSRALAGIHTGEAPPHNYFHRELEIVIEKGKGRSRRKEKMKFPNPLRLVISILMITLGFAMIVLPAPPYFEMYTIFYFNENDGFTLMDLISLIIVFCGIFTLIMTMQKHNRKE